MAASATEGWGSVWSQRRDAQIPAHWEYDAWTAFSGHSLKDWLSRGAMPKLMLTASH